MLLLLLLLLCLRIKLVFRGRTGIWSCIGSKYGVLSRVENRREPSKGTVIFIFSTFRPRLSLSRGRSTQKTSSTEPYILSTCTSFKKPHGDPRRCGGGSLPKKMSLSLHLEGASGSGCFFFSVALFFRSSFFVLLSRHISRRP